MITLLGVVVLLGCTIALGWRLRAMAPVGLAAVGAMWIGHPYNSWFTLTLVVVIVLAAISLVFQLGIDENAEKRNIKHEMAADLSALAAGTLSLVFHGVTVIVSIPVVHLRWAVVVGFTIIGIGVALILLTGQKKESGSDQAAAA